MKVIIFGASGRTGREVVRLALEAGHEVTAFVRNPVKLGIQHERLSIAQGDVTDYAAVERAVENSEVVVSTLGALSPMKFDPAVVEGMTNIVNAMEKRNVRRLIYMSAINVAGSRAGAGPLVRFFATTLLKHETEGHEQREEIIRQRTLDWTLVRPGKLSNGGHKPYRVGEDIGARGLASGLSRADAADFLVRQIVDTTYIRKAPRVMY